MNSPCIICDNGSLFTKVEHIVPESMGNTHYVLEPGIVCDVCNNQFSEFEKKVLTKTIWGFERARQAVRTKKGKPSESKTNVKIRGDYKFRKNVIEISETERKEFKYDSVTGKCQMTIKDFDGSENAMSKFLIKVGIESLYKSQRQVFVKHDFSAAKKYLRNIDNRDWPFVMTSQKITTEMDVPRYTDKHKLSKVHCKLTYAVYNGGILFRFNYSDIAYAINLSSRDIDWLKEIVKDDPIKAIFPEYFRKKIGIV